MAKHDVTFEIPQRTLKRADVKFVVKQDGVMLGTLAVSHGSLVWFPRKTTKGLKMGWTRFDAMMRNEAIKIEAR